MRESLLKKVLELTKQGNIDGFEKFYILTYKNAYRHAASFIKEPSDIWKVLCDVYVRIYEDRENLPGVGGIGKKIHELVDEISSKILEDQALYSSEGEMDIDVSEEKAITMLAVIEERVGISEDAGEENKVKDYLSSILRAIIALGVAGAAVFVILTGIKRIQSYNSKILTVWNDTVISTLASQNSESADESITAGESALEDMEPGLKVYEDGKKYLNEDGAFITDAWKEVDGNLYYFDETGYAVTGDKVVGNQVFTFWDDGILTMISRLNRGEISLKDSIQTVDGKTYFLKPVLDGGYTLYRTDARMKLEKQKELIINKVEDYWIHDGMIYYMLDGGLKKRSVMDNGYAREDLETEVVKKEGAFYLVNELEEPVDAANGTVEIENRIYRVDNGLIKYVKPANVTTRGITYYFNGSTPQTSRGIYWKNSSGEGDLFVEQGYWIDSFCLVGDWIYYSSYVGKADGYNRYSQIYRIRLDGTQKEVVSEIFKGHMMNLYYYSEKGEIYGDYNPNTDNNYGRIAVISLNGQIDLINDSAARSVRETGGEDTLELVMVSDDTISCYWHDCDWYGDGGAKILWTEPIELSASDRFPLEMR